MPGAFQLAARKGDQAPDLPTGVIYASVESSATLSARGSIAFYANLSGSGVIRDSNDSALFGAQPGAIRLIGRGGATPSFPGGKFLSVSPTDINSSDQVAFLGRHANGSRGIWFGILGNIVPGLGEGDKVEGYPPDVRLRTFNNLFAMPLNESGMITFNGTVAGPGITTTYANALWAGPALSPQVIVKSGEPAPGGKSFRFLVLPINNQVYFRLIEP